MLALDKFKRLYLTMKKMILVLGLLFFICISMVHAEITHFKPTIPKFSSTLKEQKAENQIYALGEVSFANNITIPFYGITALSPADDRLLKDFKTCSAKSCHFDFKINIEQAKQLKLLAIPEIGVVLVPRDWQDVQAHAGANGSGTALIMSPDQKQAIQLYDSSFCVGSGMPNATLYFPTLLKQSIQNEFGGYQDPQNWYMWCIHQNKLLF